MSAKENKVNRTVDGDTAEGHVAKFLQDEEVRADVRANVRAPQKAVRAASIDDEAEGHIKF